MTVLDGKSHIEKKLRSMDRGFQQALDDARSLSTHAATMGARFESRVREILEVFVPHGYRLQDALLPPRADDPRLSEKQRGLSEKQLDFVVLPTAVPRLYEELPMEWITVVGEVKTMLSHKPDIRETARKIADSAAKSSREAPVPFLVIAGGVCGSDQWLADLLASTVDSSLSWTLWGAAFVFDEGTAMSALSVNESSPIRAMTEDEEILTGVVAIPSGLLSPSAVCYLWLWAAIYAVDPVHPMNFRYMREEFERLCAKEEGIEVAFLEDGADTMRSLRVFFSLPEDQGPFAYTAAKPIAVSSPSEKRALHGASPEISSHPVRDAEPSPAVVFSPGDKIILITLGKWVDEPDTWDESPWGGSANATRNGYGYYPGMPEADLLNSCRLFWKFDPSSSTWEGIEYAAVAFGGEIRAVMRIDGIIGPFWGRWGFQGRLVPNGDLVGDIIGRTVPRRQNPVTTIEL